MQRFILACVLAVLATCGHAADMVIYYGPTGEILAAGKYTRVTVSWVNGQAVLSQQVVLDVGGGPLPPPPPPPPPPDTVTTQIQGFIASITADPDKVSTSKGVAMAYGQVLSLTTDDRPQMSADLLAVMDRDMLIALANGGVIKDAAMLRKLAETLIDQILASPGVMKTATWKPFTDGMKGLATPMDFAGVVNAYTVAQGLLGGGPVPPPPPPPPPPPTAVRAIVLRESANQSQPMAMMLNQLRNDPAWSKLVEVLDPQQVNQDKSPDPLAQAAVKAAGANPLPRLFGINVDGSVVDFGPMPTTFDSLKSALTAKGVKP